MHNGTPENALTEHRRRDHLHDLTLPNSPKQAPSHSLSSPSDIVKNDITTLSLDLDASHAPPTKKRKLTDSTARSVSTSRPISPPWKKIAVDGPTSFVEGGRRKSSRTNFVPLELLPQADKRQTRATIQKTQITKSRYGGASIQRSSPLTPITSQTQSSGRRPQSSGRSSGIPAINSPARISLPRSTPDVQPSPGATPTKRAYRKRTSLTASAGSPSQTIRKTRSSVRSSVLSTPAVRGQKSAANGWRQNNVRAKGWSEDDDRANEDPEEEDEEEEDEQEDEDDNSNEDEVGIEEEHQAVIMGPSHKPQRLNLRVRTPTIKIQHPEHIPRARRYSSFRQWFEQDVSLLGEDTRLLTEEEAATEARLRLDIVKAAEPGGALSKDRCSVYVPEPQEEPPQRYAHQDHLLAHAIYFRKLLRQEQRLHANIAKKLAHAAATEWKLRQPKTSEELEIERNEVGKAHFSEYALKPLIQKWENIAFEVEKRRRHLWDEEQSRLGKQALNKVLEQSTQLLDKRRLRGSSQAASEDEEIGDSEDQESVQSSGSLSDSESSDEVNMSSSQSDKEEGQAAHLTDDESDDNDGGGGDDNDEGLTVEELRRKYAHIPDASINGWSKESKSGIDVDPGGINRGINPHKLTGKGLSDASFPKAQINVAQPTPPIDVEDVDNIVLDSSDASTDMEDESDDDQSSSGSEDDSDDQDQDSEDNPGLLGFFSKQEYSASSEQLKVSPNSKFENIEDDEFGEEAEEVSLVPDAAQVQTPSASNSEDVLTDNLKLVIPPHPHNERKLEETIQKDRTLLRPTIDQHVLKSSSPLATPPAFVSLAEENRSPSTIPSATNPLKTPIPSLLRGTLREYQHFGLDWLAGLYANGTNGILADEMGLGKTIQTIALLAHLAEEHEVWGPHLIVVPTSVILNWEMEFKKFLPGFKVLTYYGTQEERKRKRQGWTDEDKWNVWITSYSIVLADHQIFRRKGWHYMVLDEAHNIKNFRSQRWQTLLTFRTRARLLLTGTPLQNNLTELWSLLFFLMPTDSSESGIGGFADLQEFSNWFKKPVEQILDHGRDTMDDDAKAIIAKLHKVLRPFLLRRLKADVEKQMPGKYDHVVYCKLSKRQRYLYDGFMNRTQTRETLASGNYLSIINCLMQLRKVCNHPDLFETRQIVTSLAMPKSVVADFEIKELLLRRRLLQDDPINTINLNVTNLQPGTNERFSALDTIQKQRLGALGTLRQLSTQQWSRVNQESDFDGTSISTVIAHMEITARRSRFEELRHAAYLTSLRSQRRPLYSYSLMDRLRMDILSLPRPTIPSRKSQLVEWYLNSATVLTQMVPTLLERSMMLKPLIQRFACVTPNVVATNLAPLVIPCKDMNIARGLSRKLTEPFHEALVRLSIAFPDKRLLQYDCGKLQKLDVLLRELQAGGHRALIFTQMTRVLDILEQFLNIHGHRYMRLDGATKIENRQIMTERYNNDNRILVFILSTRSGGLGINLTGADTVIFYDQDWNPAMDKQCQDRCHRIGQTRDVHIYRFVSEYTIEANILRKANQKRMLDDVVIQEGEFTTDYFDKLDVSDLLNHDEGTFDGDAEAGAAVDRLLGTPRNSVGKVFEQVEDQEDIAAARIAEKEMAQTDAADFDERAAPSIGEVAITPRTPVPQTPGGEISVAPPSSVENAIPVEEEDGDEEGGHVDEYMLRFLEWELKDVPMQTFGEKGRKKLKKVGEHRMRTIK